MKGTRSDPEDVMTDAELCKRLRITTRTLRRHLTDGPPKARRKDETGDINTIRKFVVGNKRRWIRSSVEKFINQEV